MFIDIVGCSTISNILGVKKYGDFLADFKDIAISCIEPILRDNYRRKVGHKVRRRLPKYLRYDVRGDEVCVILTYEIKYFTLPTAWREFFSKRERFLSARTRAEAEKARELFQWACKARDADRSSAWLATVCGNQCLADRRYKTAERAFLELRNAHPKDPEPLCLLGNAYGEQGKYEKEKACYKQAIKLNPYVPEWWYYLGLLRQSVHPEPFRTEAPGSSSAEQSHDNGRGMQNSGA